jgi:hypothetical protein
VRFVLAIVSFVVAAVLIGAGIAQKTIFLPPDSVAASVSVDSDARVTVIDGSTVSTFPNSPTLTIGGSDTVFAAYGRTNDVMNWVGAASYNEISYDLTTKELSSTLVEGTEDDVPDPAGSDLWLAEYSGETELKQRVAATGSKEITYIVVSNGTEAAPADIAVSWPLDNSTPWVTPLLIGGGVILLLGLALLLWAITHLRNSRGPRRRSPKMPKLPKQPRYRPSKARKALPSTRGRRSTRTAMIAAPLAIVSIIALSGCSMDPTVPPATASADPLIAEKTAAESAAPAPAVTELQATRIVQRIAQVAAEADKELDADLLKTRFAGPALEQRLADYKVKKLDDNEKLPSEIRSETVSIILPQQNESWPRTVFVAIKDLEDETVAPTALMLIQDSPRSQYMVHYSVDLEPGINFPDVAPVEVGTARVDEAQGLFSILPSDLALDYGDILASGEDSEFFSLFTAEGDTLREEVGVKARAKAKKELPDTAKLTFKNEQGDGEVIVLATIDAGAIVAVNLDEIQTVKPVETGAAVNAPKGMKALAGKSVSSKGFTATYSDQLLFYVPSTIDKDATIQLLGYASGLVSASELKK